MINEIWSKLEKGVSPDQLSTQEKSSIEEIISLLDQGTKRVCSKANNQWTVHEDIKKAILLYFRIRGNQKIASGELEYFDKVPTKKWTAQQGVRVVPPAVARFGSFIEPGAILMPSYINIGAYVGTGTMVDTWATVGSCAQIGQHVHLSGGVGIGGVLEPLQAKPVIIEDHVFVGSRCIIVEGAHIDEAAVIGAGVTITSSTKIIDVTGEKEVIHKGYVPPRAVVIPGSTNKKYPAGDYGVSCALIIGHRKESTDLKTSLNQALRDYF